jgi:hypothetical protein
MNAYKALKTASGIKHSINVSHYYYYEEDKDEACKCRILAQRVLHTLGAYLNSVLSISSEQSFPASFTIIPN